jgi:hypothetical protein
MCTDFFHRASEGKSLYTLLGWFQLFLMFDPLF